MYYIRFFSKGKALNIFLQICLKKVLEANNEISNKRKTFFLEKFIEEAENGVEIYKGCVIIKRKIRGCEECNGGRKRGTYKWQKKGKRPGYGDVF